MGKWEGRGQGGRVRGWGNGREKGRGKVREKGRGKGMGERKGDGDVGKKGDGGKEMGDVGRKEDRGKGWGVRDVERGRDMGIGKGCLGTGLGFETQVNGRVSQMGVLGLKVFPSTSMDASNDGLSMVGTPDSA